MPDPKNIQLQYYPDGTPSVLRKPVVYQALHFYQRSDILYQITIAFCRRFLPKYGDRTVDQMVQAARSTMQNIAEGSSDGASSAEVEIKLLGIARGSNQELLGDYENHIKTHQPKRGNRASPEGTPSRACGDRTPTRDVSGIRNIRIILILQNLWKLRILQSQIILKTKKVSNNLHICKKSSTFALELKISSNAKVFLYMVMLSNIYYYRLGKAA